MSTSEHGSGRAGRPITVRLDEAHLAQLDSVQRALGTDRTGAIRALIDLSGLSEADLAAARRSAQEPPSNVSEVSLEQTRAALKDVTTAYGGLSRQVQAIGNNVNQLTRLANTGESIDADAVRGLARALKALLARIEQMGWHDKRGQEAFAWLW